MNDPQVESLRYRLKTSEGLIFKEDAPALDCGDSEGHFACHLVDGDLTVILQEHHATEASALAMVEPFLKNWEIAQALDRGQRELWFEYVEPKIIDLKPPPRNPDGGPAAFGVDTVALGLRGEYARVLRTEATYPSPPSGFVASSEVRMLFARYQEYAEGREPLASMAFACYRYIREVLGKIDGPADKKFHISGGRDGVLATLRRLAGGKGRRKDLLQAPYTPKEEAWVAAAVRRLIRRVGEQAAGAQLPQITMADLPPLD
jgi:hypothetical protein